MRPAPIVALLVLLALPARAQGPCTPSLAPDMGPAGLVPAGEMRVFDDGSGPALHVLGTYYPISGTVVHRWNGTEFTAPYGTVPMPQPTFAAHDDGAGPALYVAGQLGTFQVGWVSRWSGSSWIALNAGTFNNLIARMASWENPVTSARRLVVVGSFTSVGGTSVPRIAAWNGSGWERVGGPTDAFNGTVSQIVFEPTGPLAGLYVAGSFNAIGALPVPSQVARFDGTTWTALGTGAGSSGPLCFHDDGSGRALYYGGPQALPGGGSTTLVSRWNGTSWSAVGAPTGLLAVRALQSFDDGSGRHLYACGVGPGGLVGSSPLQRWDGTAWTVVGTLNAGANFLAVADTGTGPRMHVSGDFSSGTERVVHRIARWGGSGFEALVEGGGLTGNVWSFARHDDGTGSAVYAAGELRHASGLGSFGVARWIGGFWVAVGGSFAAAPRTVASLDLGAGATLYAGGATSPGPQHGVSRWDGTSWVPVGTNLTSTLVRALAVHDDGNGKKLYVGGRLQIDGGPTEHAVARFDGTRWDRVGSAFDDAVHALIAHDAGGGTQLYAGGYFLHSHGVTMPYAARFDGADWQPFSTQLNGGVFAFARHDDATGRGTELYAGGLFQGALQRVARFDGTAWQPIGAGLVRDVYAFAEHDDGTGAGTRLVAGGNGQLARWNGTSWTGGDPTADGDLLGLASLDGGDGNGRELWIGGSFQLFGGAPAYRVAREIACTAPGTAYCGTDGADPSVAIACPCGNAGAAGHGCASSANLAGASLAASGRTSPDSISLDAGGLPPTAPCLFLKGDATLAGGIVFGDGIRCIDGALIRLGVVIASGGAASFPGPGQPLVSVRGATPVGSGLTAHYQVHYRNAAPAFCPPDAFNATNACRIVW